MTNPDVDTIPCARLLCDAKTPDADAWLTLSGPVAVTAPLGAAHAAHFCSSRCLLKWAADFGEQP